MKEIASFKQNQKYNYCYLIPTIYVKEPEHENNLDFDLD